jgi:hypothetical protein
MIISTFELLVKRIAPVSGLPANAGKEAPFRRIVQGYFLTISNPSLTRSVRFKLRATIPISTPVDLFARDFTESTNTTFVFPPPNPADNHFIAFDKTGANEFSQFQFYDEGPAGSITYRRFKSKAFTLGAGQSCSLEILPNVLNDLVIANEKLEIRGFVEIYQPYTFGPAPAATDLIISPEQRGTLLDNKYKAPFPDPATNVLDFDQVSYPIPLTSGKSLNTVGVEFEPLVLEPIPFPGGLGQQVSPLLLPDAISNINDELASLGLKVVKA